MKQQKPVFVRTILFFIGLFILLLSACLIHFQVTAFNWRMTFAYISLCVIYILFFLPGCFALRDDRKSGNIFIGGAVYFKGCVVYKILSAIVAGCIFGLLIPFAIAFSLQMAAFFIFLIYCYLSGVASDKVLGVKLQEEAKTSQLKALQAGTASMLIRVNQSAKCDEEMKKSVRKLSEDLRYLSPSNTSRCAELEGCMLDIVNTVCRAGYLDEKSLASQDELKKMIDELTMLYEQRKLMY